MRTFRPDQLEAFYHGSRQLTTLKSQGYILPMGAGKTGVSIRIADYMHVVHGVNHILVASPLRVMHHWKDEAELWNGGLPVHICHGKTKDNAKSQRPGIYVVTHRSLEWLSRQGFPDFDLIIVDESSMFKNWSAQRSKALRRLSVRAKHKITLTGSPAPNCPSEFFSQQFILDSGATLGSTITEFRDEFMFRGGFENRDWIFDETKRDQLANRLRPWYLRQENLSNLPPIIYNEIRLRLPENIRKTYATFVQDMYASIVPGQDVIAFSGGAKYNLCRQLASGGYYDENKNPQKFHTVKADALKEMLMDMEAPVLVAYQWWHELHQIRRTLGYEVPAINSNTSLGRSRELIQQWIDGKLPLLLCQPGAMSHGVDGLQKRGNTLIWYSLTHCPDTHDQLNARLYRTGQSKTTYIHYMLSAGTIDNKVLRVIQRKSTLQEEFLSTMSHESIDERIKRVGSYPFTALN